MNTEAHAENEVEFQIFSCLVIKPNFLKEINFEEKYFKNHKILSFLKKLYKQYEYLDGSLIISESSKFKNGMETILQFIDCEASPSNIRGYYKKLKDNYYKKLDRKSVV